MSLIAAALHVREQSLWQEYVDTSSEILRSDNAALASHCEGDLQQATNGQTVTRLHIIRADCPNENDKCHGQGIVKKQLVKIDNVALGVVDNFAYVGYTITSHLSLTSEINKRILPKLGSVAQ